jgi:translocation and assembly module TamB
MNWWKILKRTAFFFGLLIAAIVVAGFVVVRSPWFHRAVLVEIVQKGEAATGSRLNVQRWNFHLHPLTIELYGIVLHGSEPPSARPLLQIEKVTAGVSLGALLDRKLQLSELFVEHPVANLIVSRSGNSNLPNPPAGKAKSNVNLWSLAVGRSVLRRGEIFYNNKKSQLDADVYNLKAEVRFDPALTQYGGSISYQNGTLKYGNYSSLPHSLQARFTATPAGASLDSLLLTIGSSRIAAHGELINFQAPEVNAQYEVLIHTQDYSSLSQGVSPAGDVRIIGKMQYHDVAGQPFLRSLSADGTVSSGNLQAVLTEARVAVKDLGAHYRLENGSLDVSNMTAEVIGGHLHAELTVRNLENTSSGIFRATLERASIESARLATRRADLRRMPITGTLTTKVRGNWAEGISNIQVLGNGQVAAAVWKNSSERKTAIPVDVSVHFLYDAPKNRLTLRQTNVRVPAASAMVNGEISQHSNLHVHAESGDLHRLTELAALLRAGSSSTSLPVDVSGKARVDAVVSGSLARPSISGQISAQDLAVQGSRWKTAQITLHASPSELKISDASLVSARQGNLKLSAEVGLHHWSYEPANSIRANLTARDISVSALAHLAMVNYPVAGKLSANITVHGSELHPTGQGSLLITNATAYHQPVQELLVQFHTAHDAIDSTLMLKVPAGTASGSLDFTPKTKAYNLNLQALQMVIQKLHAVSATNVPITGTVTASAQGAGTLHDPQLSITLQAAALQVRDTSVNSLNVAISLNGRQAHLSLNSTMAQAYVHANANIDLVGEYHTQATVDSSRFPLGPFLSVYAPSLPEGFNGETEVHASLSGPLKNKSKLVAHVTIPTLTGTYQSLQFSNVGPINADFADSVLVLQPAEIRGTQTMIHFQGRVPVASSAPMTVNAQGNVNLQLLAMFASDVQSSGTADFDMRATGDLPHPKLQGQIQIRKGAFTTSSAPVGITKVNGTLDLSNERIQISKLTGEIGGGEVSAGGSIALRPSLQFNVALQGKNMRILYPAGVRSELEADLTFTGDMKSALLRGRTLIQSLNFTPDFNLSTVGSQVNAPSLPSATPGFANSIKLSVAVQSAQNLAARSSQLTVSGMANLRIAGTVADPVVIGRVDLTSGELFFMSNRYRLQRGIISFNDLNQTRPVLNVQVTALIEQYNLTLTLVGPLDRLNTSYVSNPALPTADIISLIYRGQTVEEAAAAGTSTDSILAGGIASEFSSGLRNLTGISSLQIDPLLGGNGTNPSARIAIQQRVTKNFLFTFSTDVTQPESEIVLGQYQLTPRWSVTAERDQLGAVSVEGQFRTKF